MNQNGGQPFVIKSIFGSDLFLISLLINPICSNNEPFLFFGLAIKTIKGEYVWFLSPLFLNPVPEYCSGYS